jgi:YidC/Oxa1 family membrane protein insertase
MLIMRLFPGTFGVAPKPATSQPATQAASQAVATRPGTTSMASNGQVVQDSKKYDQLRIGSSDLKSGFEMQAEFSNEGSSLSAGQLTSTYSKSVMERNVGYTVVSPLQYPSELRQSLATQGIILSDDKGQNYIDLNQARWFHEIKTGDDEQSIRFWVDLTLDGQKVARLVKTFTLKKGTFDLDMALTLENLSKRKFTAIITQDGAIGIKKEDRRSPDQKAFGGSLEKGSTDDISVQQIDRPTLEKKPERTFLLTGSDQTPAWAGLVNKYFAAILASVDEKGQLDGKSIAKIEARSFIDDQNVPDEQKFHDDLTTIWTTKPIELDAGASKSLYFQLYLGPKADTVLSKGKYFDWGYMRTFDTSWCTFQALADFMAWLLKGMYFLTRNYGIAIILLVIIVRVVLHPITKSSQMNMMRMQRDMQKLQPKIAALKAKYKDNREAMNKAMMDLYKEEGVNPAGSMLGCLPMMLQMPIWVALWTALNNSFELRHQPFFFWIKDLAGPDALFTFVNPAGYHVPLLSLMLGPIHEINILPLIMIVSMILQQKFGAAPSAPDADPAQAKQQKIMFYFMGVFFGLILYNAPSGLNLYILTSNFLGIAENKRIRAHLEAEAKLPPKPKKNVPGWWAKLQNKAEGLAKQYEQEKSAKNKGKK